MKNKTFYAAVVVLAFSAFVSLKFYLSAHLANTKEAQMSEFPKTIGQWTSREIPLNERDYEILETRNLIMRNYSDQAGETVNLYIIYSKDNRKVSHPPEICLQGTGADVLDKSAFPVSPSIRAVKLIIQKGASKEMVVYWYKAGKLHTNIYLVQQIKQVIEKLRGRDISVAMIRMVANIENNDEESALRKIKRFYSAVDPLLEKYVP